MYEWDAWELREKKLFELEESKKEFRRDVLNQLNQNDVEKKARQKRMIQNMIGEVTNQKNLRCKSLKNVAAKLQNEIRGPSINSYGGCNVYQRYKQNNWFENVNINALKRIKND